MLTKSYCQNCGGFVREIVGDGKARYGDAHVNTVDCLQALNQRATQAEAALVVVQTQLAEVLRAGLVVKAAEVPVAKVGAVCGTIVSAVGVTATGAAKAAVPVAAVAVTPPGVIEIDPSEDGNPPDRSSK